MGAWGYDIFDDDTAYDFTADIQEGDALAFFRQSFEAAIAAGYIGYDEGHAVTVSAAYIDAILNGTHYRNDAQEDFDAFVAANRNLEVSSLKPLAVAALQKVVSADSELTELWTDNVALYPKWKASIEQMMSRLANERS